MAKQYHIYNNEIRKWTSFIRRVGLLEFFLVVFRHFFSRQIIARLPCRFIAFDGREVPYFYHKYNITWVTERAIEIPIILDLMSRNPSASILEVGNVLGHYQPVTHSVLDKFEEGAHLIREDILTYSPAFKYDLIVSISTFEHIGYEDDGEADPEKICKAIHNCQKLLSANGKLIITVPFGYNRNMDAYFAAGKIHPLKSHYFAKTSKLEWRVCSREEALHAKYGSPYPYANAILIAEFQASQ